MSLAEAELAHRLASATTTTTTNVGLLEGECLPLKKLDSFQEDSAKEGIHVMRKVKCIVLGHMSSANL